MPDEKPSTLTEWLARPRGEFDAELDRARHEGDGKTAEVDADALMESVLLETMSASRRDAEVKYGRLGYNLLLDVADRLMAAPELALTEKSRVSEFLADVPAVARDYLDPVLAPDWVDEEKLAVAGAVWEENTIPLLLVLYSASLPGCYLIKHGIPALYDTGKLAEAKYIGQRLYETALMLDAVMSGGGIAVVNDTGEHHQEALGNVMDEVAPGAWTMTGRSIKLDPGHESVQGVSAEDLHERVNRGLREQGEKGAADRFLWGRGYLSAKKVRALHSSMRFMLQGHCPHGHGNGGGHEENSDESEKHQRFFDVLAKRGIKWDSDVFGRPVNQEDQAFTLLTFGYLLPRGLEHWGCKLSAEQKDSFLHLWKTVGFIMGVRTDFTTDRWDEAEELYYLLLRRQAGASEAGRVLTETVMNFSSQYLPRSFGLSSWLPGRMIIDQLSLDQHRIDRSPPSEQPVAGHLDLKSCILSPEVVERASTTWARVSYWLLRRVVEAYFFVRNDWLMNIPGIGGLVRSMLHEPGRELYESFKGEYSRKPFYIPCDAVDWTLRPGVSKEFLAELQRWRRRLFMRIGVGLVCLTGSTLAALVFFGAVVTNLASLLSPDVRALLVKEVSDVVGLVDRALSTLLVSWLVVSFLVTLALFFGGVWILRRTVPRFFASRPTLHGEASTPRRK